MFIQNRAGRIVEVPEDLGNEMIKNDGAILANPEIEIDDEIKNENLNENSNPSDESLKCPYCGKVCANLLGFNKHVEACKKKAIETATPNGDGDTNSVSENDENKEKIENSTI